MSWSGGSELFHSLITILKDQIEDHPLREELYLKLIPLFEDYDCDTLYECVGEGDTAFDNVFKTLYPDDLDEEGDGATHYDAETGDWVIYEEEN